MDETEQYKQRLEAIAEKRRLQEEQDRARREKEDERLRQQQLKRKSLRDQWLMEGTPSSPTSPNIQSPRSSLWSSQNQDMEKPIDKLQPENQRLAEEQEAQEAVKVTEAEAEKIQDVMQNGQGDVTRSETSDSDMKETQNPAETEAAVVLTVRSGTFGHLEEHSYHNNSEQSVLNQNGSINTFESVGSIKLEPEIIEAASGPNISLNEEEEEGTLVMRAEPVFITDEADDVPEDLSSQEDQQESDQASLPQSESGNAVGEVLELEVETEIAPEPLPDSENSEASELTVEAQPATEEKDMEGAVKSSKTNAEEETKTIVQEGKMEDLVCVQLQSPASVTEGTTVALVPVYSEVPLSALSPEAAVQAKDEASATPVEEEAEVKVENPACQPSQFQEVPLTDPQENQKKEAVLGEQEPLLLKVQACTVNSADSTTSPVTAETLSPTTRSQETENQSPKRKTCQCCSVM